MFDLPPVAIGAVTAAFIAGAVSLLSLIISKEQKTSELRQSWIDALRSELAEYITQMRAIQDALRLRFRTNEERLDRLGPLFADLNRVSVVISLRLNPKERHPQAILSAMQAFQNSLGSRAPASPAGLQENERVILESAKALLKSEWERVKQGELTFRFAKWLLGAFIASAALFLVQFAVLGRQAAPAEQNGASQVIDNAVSSRNGIGPNMEVPSR